MTEIEKRLAVAERTVSNQAHLISYLNTYIAYLNDSVTEKDFMELAAEYVKEKDPIDEQEVLFNWVYLKSLAPEIDLDDFASMMNYDTEKLVYYFISIRG